MKSAVIKKPWEKYKSLFILAAIVVSAAGFSPDKACSAINATSLLEGKALLDAGRYEAAVEKFRLAYKETPVMNDYLLFFTAGAYSEMGRYGDSEITINELLKVYPETLLKKRARELQVRNNIKNCEERDDAAVSKQPGSGIKTPAEHKCGEACGFVEQYHADYPEDSDTAFLSAQFLKRHGKAEMAKKIFRQLYINNSPFSETAYKELKAPDLTTADLLAKASNFINSSEYRKAELLLRKILITSDSVLKGEIRRKLGLALFRQKKYKDAADEYLKLGDIYNTARSQYRAGEFEVFNKTVSGMMSAEDNRAGALLIALASKKRREGKTEEALKIYGDVKKMYSPLAEEALWNIAWTYYRRGDFNGALKTLKELKAHYSSSMYIYWMARCLENMPEEEAAGAGETAETLYRQAATRKDFYGLLSKLRLRNGSGARQDFLKTLTGLTAGSEETAADSMPRQGNNLAAVKIPDNIARALERSNILLALGMKNDALLELFHVSDSVSDPQLLLYLGRKLQEMGAYKKAITLISRITTDQEIHEQFGRDIKQILYPLAYWPIVREMSDKYGIDPLIPLSVMREESRYDPEAASVAGALGLMQLMPETAHKIAGSSVPLKGRLVMRDITTNITIGAYYLSFLQKEFGSFPETIAAYNAGPDKTREWLKEGLYKAHDEFIEDIPYNETRHYVKRVMLTYFSYAAPDRQ